MKALLTVILYLKSVLCEGEIANMHPIIYNDMKEIETALPKDIVLKLLGKTVLITGANGMLPSYCVYFLMYLNTIHQDNPIKILALVRNQEKAKKRFQEFMSNKNFKLLMQDVCLPIKYPDDIDYIIHAASQASPKYYSIDPVGTGRPNTIGTYNLLELARDKKSCSFIFFSSSEIYGDTSDLKSPIKENDMGPLDPMLFRSCYAESKRMGENLCVAYAHQYNVSSKVVRLGHTYGPTMSLDDGRIFADLVSDIVNNKNITLYSDGEAERFFCYITDAIIGIFLILLNGEKSNVYNLFNTKTRIKVGKLAQMLVELYPEKNLKVVFEKRKDDKRYVPSPWQIPADFDVTKLNKLGWIPKIGLKEGFTRTIKCLVHGNKNEEY